MSKKKLSKLLALYLPYVLMGLVVTNFGEAWRLAVGKELGDKIMSLMGTIPAAFANPLPSLHPLDLLVGLCCGAGLRLAVYLRGKNAKKYRHGMEYGSARWGGSKDIEPFTAAWLGGDSENAEQAARYCRAVYEAGFSPICPPLYLPLFLNDAVPEEHKSGIDMGRDLLRRSHVLVVCGHTMTEAMKNDIAVAQRLGITATTLEGILTVKGQGKR